MDIFKQVLIYVVQITVKQLLYLPFHFIFTCLIFTLQFHFAFACVQTLNEFLLLFVIALWNERGY